MKNKIFLSLLLLLATLTASAQHPNATVCSAFRDNTENTGDGYFPKPNEIIKDYYYFTININPEKIKIIVPKFIYISCNGCEGFNVNYRYKLELKNNTTYTYNNSCENSILDKYGKNYLFVAERPISIYKPENTSNGYQSIEQNLVDKYQYATGYQAVLEVEIDGKLETLFCKTINYLARP